MDAEVPITWCTSLAQRSKPDSAQDELRYPSATSAGCSDPQPRDPGANAFRGGTSPA